MVANELGISMAKNAYFCLIESHLRYGIPFWGFCNRSLFSSVFVLQKRAIRYVCKARARDHCKPLFIQQNILTLPCLFILETVLLIYKRYRNSPHTHHYPLRSSNNLPLPIPTSTLTKNSLMYEGLKLYNHFPCAIRKAGSPRLFKRTVRNILLGKAYYNLNEFFEDIL